MKKILFIFIMFVLTCGGFTSCVDEPDYPSYEYSSGQCCATTKKGTRCKNKAKKGSIYCGIHQH